jgi:[ribosomal protein S5]-alanine N-acetyltransferase
MIYQNEMIRIVPFERNKHMTDTYRSWMNDPATTRFNTHGLFPYTKGQQEQFVKDIEQGSESKIIWAIELTKETHVDPIMSFPNAPVPKTSIWSHVGNCSLQSINLHNRSAEFAIVIGEANARQKGHGSTVLGFVLQHAFIKMGLNRVWTGTSFKNIGMQRAALKNGMKLEGCFRQGMWCNGEFADIMAYAILANEYKKGK